MALRYALTSSFCMQSSDVIQPPASMELGRELPSRSSNPTDTFVIKPRYLMCSQLPQKMLLLLESKCWLAYTMGNLGKSLILYAISNSVRRWLPTSPVFNHRVCHPLQLQRNTTVSVCTSRYSSGKVLEMNFCQYNGDGKKVKED